MTTGIILLALSIGQIAWMVWAIRSNTAETHISLVEAAILKVGNAEPLPKSRLGIIFDKIQLWAGLVLGIVMAGLGLLFIFVE